MAGKNRIAVPVAQALLAALLFGINTPFSKMLLSSIPPMFLAALLYIGAGLGMSAVYLARLRQSSIHREAGLVKKDLPWVLLMVVLDIAAPFLLLWGLTLTTAANASVLYNFELVATAVIACVFFKEGIGRRLWIALGAITLASLFLTADFRSFSEFKFSLGSVLVLCACLCWGLENNCTRCLALRDPVQVVMVKGYGSGAGALAIAYFMGSIRDFPLLQVFGALLLGFVSYGLSIFYYVKAQRGLGAARTGMYYAAAPFIGVLVSILVLKETPDVYFYVGTLLMAAGVIAVLYEKHAHLHGHESLTHTHRHCHDDAHHGHPHDCTADEAKEHTHEHWHEEMAHAHEHRPDTHHRHSHPH